MIRRPPRSTQSRSSAASDVYKRQEDDRVSGPGVDVNKLRQQVGIVFQAFNLFPHMTVLRNVAIGPVRVHRSSWNEAKEIAMDQLDRLGLTDKAGAYPEQLSGGQKQRVAIARALAMKPRLIRSSAEYPEASEGSEKESACRSPPSGLAIVTSYPASTNSQ